MSAGRLHLIGENRSGRHDVWATEIRLRLDPGKGRGREKILDKIPKKLLDKLKEVES